MKEPKRCSMCGRKFADLVMSSHYPWRVKIEGKQYATCSPVCAFDLGAKMAADLKTSFLATRRK